MARRKGISSTKTRNNALLQPRAQESPARAASSAVAAAAASPAPAPAPAPTSAATSGCSVRHTTDADNRGSGTMPLAQEKPRYEYSFTNNNDHNYLHKKFKKMASTVPRSDELSSESDSSLHRDTSKAQSSLHSSISNHSIPAAHPEIEKMKYRVTAVNAEIDRSVENNVQTNFRDRPNLCEVNIVKVNTGETRFDEDIVNKTENVDMDASRDIASGASGRYVCPYCRLSCAKPSVLQKHIRAHTNERPYPCIPCGFAFKTKSNLYKHCRSRAHALRSQGGENAPPITEEDWSPGSESDTSLPATSISETGSEGIVLRLENSRASELSSPDLCNERVSPGDSINPPESNKIKSIYKPKFHRASLYQDDEERSKKILSPNPNFLNEHISKIISDNEAIVDILETPLQKKYGKIKQIAESKQILNEDSINYEIKSEPGPLNLSKSSSDDITRRKRCFSESFGQLEYNNHPLNPEGSIIKDLLLKTKGYASGLFPVTSESYDSAEVFDNCPYCNIPIRAADNLELHIAHYCKGSSNHNRIPVTSLSPREVIKNFRSENIFVRSNSINVTLQETQTQNTLTKTKTCTERSPLSGNKPDNLILIKPESNDIIAPLPSPGPLLGNTRLVDSRISSDFSRSKMANLKVKPIQSPKRRLDSRPDVFSPRSGDETLHGMEIYPQNKMRCFESNPTTLRSLEELSHSPMRQNSTSLQMFGGEVKILDHLGSTTTLRIEPTRQLSPIMITENTSPAKNPAEASNIIQSGLHSGGTITHNPPTPKENVHSPHQKTPRIMLSIAASVPTPNLTVTSLPTPNITHFQFPPNGAITSFNPLTLPPLSPAASPNGAMTILHGGKLIPHVPGIPGPNTPVPYGGSSGLLLKYSQNGEFARSITPSIKDDNRSSLSQARTKAITPQNFDNQISNVKMLSPTVSSSTKDILVQIPNTGTSNNIKIHSPPMPRFKIRQAGEKLPLKRRQIKGDDKVNRSQEVLNKNVIASDSGRTDFQKSTKLVEKVNNMQLSQNTVVKTTDQEIRNFNFENFITKSEIYNSGNPGTSVAQKGANLQEPLAVFVQTSERSETLYFQKNINASKHTNDENKSRFLRPSTLPLKPGTFTPKKHHGITPNANTMPLISPETPRPAKAYGQLYLNGNAYTYLGLKCSTKVFYCTLNRPQPTYVPNQVSLSMYCNWQILLEQAPHPLGFSTFMSLYDSRHRPQDVSIAKIKQDLILTHSSKWNKDFKENKQRSLLIDGKESKLVAGDGLSTKSKELAGGFESNEEYTYVRGRGRGRYVCLECGIRCKKPSMLKKHIRTHTDVRPYTCKHCSFSFKTKGNLTKHMKSKAHYKKCCELGINPNEGTDIDASELNQGSGETDDESDSDMDDGNEGETESSDTDSWKSRLPEHEAAHSLLSLSGSRPPSAGAPGLLSSARPSTYPYTPAAHDDVSANVDAELTDSAMELDSEPMDLSKGELKPLSEIPTARESSVLAYLASNTAKLPLQHTQWTNGEPMLHAYLTEKALQDTKIKQSQFISKIRKQELNRIEQQESSNLVLNSYGTHDSTPKTPSTPTVDVFSVSTSYSKATTVTSAIRVINTACITSAETLPKITTSIQRINSPSIAAESNKTISSTETNTSTENAKFVASEYLKMARGKAETFDSTISDKAEKPDNNKSTFNNSAEETDKRDKENSESEIKQMHSEPYPLARKVVIGAGGIAFKVDTKSKDYQTSSAYTPGRLTEDGRSVCVVCNKSFSKPSQLRLHINIHYMERPFRCSACAVSFRTRGHLQKHERSGSHNNKVSMTSTFGAATSSNPRPFRCSDCNIAFRIHGHLAKHLRSKMHVMRLECLSKLPFGTFAEIERAGVSLTDIDTTDCANSLASLQLLAQKLHEKDPTKLESWDPTMVPPLLPAGRESSDDEDGAGPEHSAPSHRSPGDHTAYPPHADTRTIVNSEGHHTDNARTLYSATDT